MICCTHETASPGYSQSRNYVTQQPMTYKHQGHGAILVMPFYHVSKVIVAVTHDLCLPPIDKMFSIEISAREKLRQNNAGPHQGLIG